MRLHHASSRAGAAPVARYSIRSWASTRLASPAIGMVAGQLSDIPAPPTSMWMKFARGANSDSLHARLIAGQADVRDRLVVDLCAREVLRDVHQHRAGAPAARKVKGLVDRARYLVRALDHERVLDDRHRDADRVGLLEAVRAQQFGAHLPGEEHDGDGVHHRV